jgi:hypothetical protein
VSRKQASKKTTMSYNGRNIAGPRAHKSGIRPDMSLVDAAQVSRACDAFWVLRGIEQPKGICFRVFQS